MRFIGPGSIMGRLTLEEICHDRTKIPVHTPQSYRNMGELRWATCQCGAKVVYPTVLLEKGDIKSCGCLKREKAERKKAETEIRDLRRPLRERMKQLQYELAIAKLYNRQSEVTRIGGEIRSLATELAHLKLRAHAIKSK